MSAKDSNENQEDTPAEGDVAVTPLDDEGKKLNIKKILMIVIPVVIVIVLAALYFTGQFDKLLGKEQHNQEAAEQAKKEAEKETAVFMELPDMLINLSTQPGTQQRYLKMKIKLELSKEEDRAKVEPLTPRVVDQFQTFLREMRVEDLRGSAGMYRLRQELLYRVNLAARPVEVKDVLFQEILIQ